MLGRVGFAGSLMVSVTQSEHPANANATTKVNAMQRDKSALFNFISSSLHAHVALFPKERSVFF